MAYKWGLADVTQKEECSNDQLRRGLGGWLEVDDPKIAIVADDGARLRPGEQYIFLLQDHTYGGSDAVALYPCGILTTTGANLEIVRATTAQSFK